VEAGCQDEVGKGQDMVRSGAVDTIKDLLTIGEVGESSENLAKPS